MGSRLPVNLLAGFHALQLLRPFRFHADETRRDDDSNSDAVAFSHHITCDYYCMRAEAPEVGRRSGGAHPCLVSRDDGPAHCLLHRCSLVVLVSQSRAVVTCGLISSLLASGGLAGRVVKDLRLQWSRTTTTHKLLAADVLQTAKTS